MAKQKKTPEHIQTLLKSVIDHYDLEDRAVRERQIREWRKYKLYWNGWQRIFEDAVAHDWRVYDINNVEEDNDAAFYDKPINILRAYLEAIIAALSISVPTITCCPDNANDPLDVQTAKAGEKIARLIYKHNDVSLLWLHALYILCTEGLVACYSYPKEDESYGTYEAPDTEEEEIMAYVCPYCHVQIPDDTFINQELNEFMPDDDDVELHDLLANQNEKLCPACSAVIDSSLQKVPFIVERLVGYTRKPKSRQCIEVYGGLNVKVPNYARNQKECSYLFYSYETHYSFAVNKYTHLHDKYGKKKVNPGYSGTELYERWGRLSPQYHGEFPVNTVTIRNCWLRSESFNVLDEDDTKELKRRYPDGAKVVFVNDDFGEACNESLDDCWTVTENPLSDYIHFDPLAKPLISVQDITNDLVALILQTIEQGIPQTFADPAFLDFDAYRKAETTPGSVYPTKPISTNQKVGDGFTTLKTAQLSAETLPFGKTVLDLGQLSSGSFPSIFGGTAEAGSKTASEYSMSRAQALQRLQLQWKMITVWWKNVFGKVIPSYIKDVVDDEHFVEKKNDTFINTVIYKSELEGKIGDIELDSAENMPITWQQKRDILFQLLPLAADPRISSILGAVENIPFLAEALGLPELHIPGATDREKQWDEIRLLLASQPQDEVTPSIIPDQLLDNHQIEAEVCRDFLISEEGRQAKADNDTGYLNVLLHMKMHMMFATMSMAMSAQPQPSGSSGPASKPEQEVTEDGNTGERVPIH